MEENKTSFNHGEREFHYPLEYLLKLGQGPPAGVNCSECDDHPPQFSQNCPGFSTESPIPQATVHS